MAIQERRQGAYYYCYDYSYGFGASNFTSSHEKIFDKRAISYEQDEQDCSIIDLLCHSVTLNFQLRLRGRASGKLR